MDEKKQTEAQSNKPVVPPVKKSNNKVLFWILGGCLVLLLIGGLVIGGIAYWGYKKVNQAASDNKRQIEERQNEANKIKEESQNIGKPVEAPAPAKDLPQAISEEPQTNPDTSQNEEGALPFAGEKQIGYVKKVYTKNGKNYLSIDYIQWLTGTEAQKAMREDGACPKTGECIVYDDYYIRNQNPLIRTFEISPDATITMQTYTMETTGQIQPEIISFEQFRQLFSANADMRFKNVPYIVEISSNKITKINEQYIP